MKYDSKSIILAKKRKQCVYCNKRFLVSENIVKRVLN